AIDDVKVTSNDDRGGEDKERTLVNCNFDAINLCGFVQRHDDQRDWERSDSGTTPSSTTGPQSGGHSGDTFMFVEASTNNTLALLEGQGNATIDTPRFSIGGEKTLIFYYHAFGQQLGILKVTAQPSNAQIFIFDGRTDESRDEWMEVIELLPRGTSSVRFQ
ncbi:unnamed protein product, partial [Owenia fusiformis]